MIYNKNKIKELLKERGLFATKKRGQNFLIDPNISRKLVDLAAIDENTCVIEIGPGLGSLTNFIVKKAFYTYCVEFDKGFYTFLTEKYENEPKIDIIHKDILKTDLEEILNKHPNKRWVVIGNLPYNITAKLFIKVLNMSQLSCFICTTQKEVAKRLTADISTSSYGSLSIVISFMANVKKCFDIPSHVFFPIPKVRSSVLKVIPIKNEYNIKNKEEFFKFVRNSFISRRKTIINNWKSFLNEANAKEIIKKCNLNILSRAEELSTKQFVNCFKVYKNIIGENNDRIC